MHQLPKLVVFQFAPEAQLAITPASAIVITMAPVPATVPITPSMIVTSNGGSGDYHHSGVIWAAITVWAAVKTTTTTLHSVCRRSCEQHHSYRTCN